MDEDNKVYYKIYKSKHLDGKLTVLCMQWFDECNYEEDRFLKDKDGIIAKYASEKEAVKWLLENIAEELIDPDYVKEKIKLDADYYKSVKNKQPLEKWLISLAQVLEKTLEKGTDDLIMSREYASDIHSGFIS